MKSKFLLMGGMLICAGVVAGCHDDDRHAPAAAQPQALDTAQVLALAQKTSETSTPIVVNNGGITLTDTSETTAPIAVTSM